MTREHDNVRSGLRHRARSARFQCRTSCTFAAAGLLPRNFFPTTREHDDVRSGIKYDPHDFSVVRRVHNGAFAAAGLLFLLLLLRVHPWMCPPNSHLSDSGLALFGYMQVYGIPVPATTCSMFNPNRISPTSTGVQPSWEQVWERGSVPAGLCSPCALTLLDILRSGLPNADFAFLAVWHMAELTR